jgi:hypothetical protein
LIFRILRTREGVGFAGVSTFSVSATAKDLYDAEEIVGQLLLWRASFGVEDCDADVVEKEDSLEEFEGEATKTVPCGHDNLFDISLYREFQNGRKPLAFPIDAAGDVGDDETVGAPVAEESDLSLEVIFLSPR